jgi:hypothetical protein
MQFADLALGDRDQRDAAEREVLEQRGDVLLVSAEAVEALGHHHVEASSHAPSSSFW